MLLTEFAIKEFEGSLNSFVYTIGTEDATYIWLANFNICGWLISQLHTSKTSSILLNVAGIWLSLLFCDGICSTSCGLSLNSY